MASRTPDQLAIVLGSINKIADPAARLSALNDLQAEAVQGESDAGNLSPVDKAMGGANVTQPGAYTALLSGINQSKQDANAAVQKQTPGAAATPASMTQAPAEGSLDASNLQAKMDQLGIDNQKLGISNAQLQLQTAAQQSIAKLRQAQIDGKDTTAALNQAKFDFAQLVAQHTSDIKDQQIADAQQRIKDAETKAANAYQLGLQKADETSATALQGQEVTQADTRATNAKDILNNTQSTGLDIAKGGGSAADIGKYLQGALSVAPSFTQQMGGAPVGFTPDHFSQLLNMVKSGQVPPDANGNVVPNAIKMLANQNGVIADPRSPATTTPSGGGGMGIVGGNTGGGGDASAGNAPQFTAPDALAA